MRAFILRVVKRGLASGIALLLLAAGTPAALAHEGHEHGAGATKKSKRSELGLSAAVDGQGRLWVVSKETTAAGDFVVVRHSVDEGKSWSGAQHVNAVPEPVAAPGEERPRILLGSKNQVYVVWTRPGGKNYAGDIRFAASLDGGVSWGAPVTVQQDAQPGSHRHPSMVADRNGRLYVLWIDRRDVDAAKTRGQPHPGASLYYAVSADEGKQWRGDFKLSDASCDCCRLALQPDADGMPLVFWRQVFANSERDHAMARLTPDGQNLSLRRATMDQWQVEACPDHGPALAVTAQARHAVWFDMQAQNGKVFYGRLAPVDAPPLVANGVEGQRALPDGAEHADIVASGNQVWVAWQRFDGQQNTVKAMVSDDGGQSWREQTLAASSGSVDQPRLLLQGKNALLVWNTAAQGIVVRKF